MDFGTIKNTVRELYVESHINKDQKGKDLFKKFLKTINESDILSTLYVVYNNIEIMSTNNDVIGLEYLRENLNTLNSFNVSDIIKENDKLIKLLNSEGVDLSNRTTLPLHESLNILITTKRDITQLNLIHENKLNVIKHMKDNCEVIEENLIKETVDGEKFLTVATNLFNQKYETLSEDEKILFKSLRSGDDKAKTTLMDVLIKETIGLINDRLKITDSLDLKSKLLETKDIIYTMKESDSNTIDDSIIKLHKIKSFFI